MSVQTMTSLPLDTPVYDDQVRFVCMSDTHCKAAYFSAVLPPGDVFLHAGDFTDLGRPHEVEEFNAFLGTLPYEHKIVVAGNHELSFDDEVLRRRKDIDEDFDAQEVCEYLRSRNIMKMKDVLVNCTYLEDAETTVFGLRVYGSPWHPDFQGWAFSLPVGHVLCEKFEQIPADIDVLVTHGPPKGYGDLNFLSVNGGCEELLSAVQHRVRPKVHVFGHTHEAYGVATDGVTMFINASNMNIQYKPVNKPVIFDLPLPTGVTKN